MRFYDLKLYQIGAKTPYRRWTTHPNQYDPAALNVVFDVLTTDYATPVGTQMISVEGVALEELTQAQQFVGMDVTLAAGMSAGLPLANPKQKGTIVTGKVWQSYGNWQGTEMTLDLVINPAQFSLSKPAPFSLKWMAGVPLADALKSMLNKVYPQMTVNVQLSRQYTQDFDAPQWCSTLEQLSTWLKQWTLAQFGDAVLISIENNQILIRDSHYSPPPIAIDFNDLVGQPVWIDVNVIQVKLVMRGDLSLGAIITLPRGLLNTPGFVISTEQAKPSLVKYKTTFTGNFTVIKLRHIGELRATDGTSWVTVVDCVPNG